MDNEIYAFALKNALNEIQNICPDITNALIFGEDGAIIATDEKIPEKTTVRIINALDNIIEKTQTIGDLEKITIEGSKGRMNTSRTNSFYFVTTTSQNADLKYVDAITSVMIPTILKVVENFHPAPLKNNLQKTQQKPTISIEDETDEPKEFCESSLEGENKPKENFKPETDSLLVETPANQLIVDNLGGLLVPSDTVRVENQILLQWEEQCEGKEIEGIQLETFDGKTIQCKVKPIKDSKQEGKGIIQVPEKIRQELEIKKGELVKVRPILSME